MNGNVVTATELKNRLGQYLEASVAGPVFIEKSGRRSAVLISQRRYEELIALEDELWAQRAITAERSGYVGHEEALRKLSAEPPTDKGEG